MNKSYQSYLEAKLLRRAIAARLGDPHVNALKYIVKAKALYNGEKYITPCTMALYLKCNLDDLCIAVAKHKRAIGKLLFDGNYGNANYIVSIEDKIRLQGWINFLSNEGFKDSDEAQEIIRILKEESAK